MASSIEKASSSVQPQTITTTSTRKTIVGPGASNDFGINKRTIGRWGKCSSWQISLLIRLILLMEEILHVLGCMKPCTYRDIYHINWCRISFINKMSSWWFQPLWKILYSQNGNLPQIGMKLKNIWNHHPDDFNIRLFGGKMVLQLFEYIWIAFDSWMWVLRRLMRYNFQICSQRTFAASFTTLRILGPSNGRVWTCVAGVRVLKIAILSFLRGQDS